MILMSEMPGGDTHDVIHHGGQVVAVVVPIGEIRYASHEEAGRRLGLPSR
jgi:hypothetical protein